MTDSNNENGNSAEPGSTGLTGLEQEFAANENIDDILQSIGAGIGDVDKLAMLEYLCLVRFPTIQLFDSALLLEKPFPENYPGELIKTLRAGAPSYLIIYIYEHAIMIGVGDMAYAEGSNYSRMYNALHQLAANVLGPYAEKWSGIAISATHEHLENVAFAILNVHQVPNCTKSSAATEYGYTIIERVRRGFDAELRKQLGWSK
ncbi:MAG: hypothetical protein Tsb005_17000 [Gammaproteobacteria bacterium]